MNVMVNQDTLQEARAKIATANERRKAAKSMRESDDVRPRTESSPGTYFTYSQRAIEHGTKALFLLFGVSVPTNHVIEMNSEAARNLVEASAAQLYADHSDGIARMLFINNMYANSYPVSEYGIETSQRQIEADDFLHSMEGDQAYEHANEVIQFCDYITTRAASVVDESN